MTLSSELSGRIIVGDNRQTLKQLETGSVQCVVTSPPYFGLRDYGEDDQIGLEATPQEFVEQLCLVFDEVWRVLKDDGTIWVNLGDSYAAFRDSKSSPDSLRSGDGTKVAGASNRNPSNLRKAGLKHKDLIGVPWRFAFAMQERGWYLRQDIIWAKPNPMPESVTDRCTKSHEYIFLMSKSPRYFYDNEAIKEDSIWANDVRAGAGRIAYDGKRQGIEGQGQEAFVSITDKRNKRSVWSVNTKPYREAHFAVYPTELIEPCILAGSKEGDTILDPFSGSGTTGEVALKHGRNYVGLELNPDYAALSERRLYDAIGMFGFVEVA
jgi:DNA modification methylase